MQESLYLIPPERLEQLWPSLSTGTLLAVHNPHSWICAFMRWVLRHKLYHHLDIVRIDCGLPFIVGAKMFERTRQRSLQHWIQEREDCLITVKIPDRVIDEKLIVQELDKPYDNAAALSKIHERIFGKWNGHTGNHAVKKNFCTELAARVWEKANAYNAGIVDFDF